MNSVYVVVDFKCSDEMLNQFKQVDWSQFGNDSMGSRNINRQDIVNGLNGLK